MSKDVGKLMGINSQLGLINIYKAFHQTKQGIYIFQVPMQNLSRYSVYWVIKYVLIYIK